MKSVSLPICSVVVILVLVVSAFPFLVLPASAKSQLGTPTECSDHSGEIYLLVGGLNGTWFRTTQWPKLFQIYLSSRSVTKLTVTTQPGDVWSGEWNGSQWLISGAGGAVPGTNISDPFIYLYDGCEQIVAGTQYLWDPQVSWHGGDVFASSYNGSHWLLSGLGSDSFPGQSYRTNHMALGTFDGYNFTDLSANVPNQQDFILYANAWNGHYWLVGGGYTRTGALYAYSGHSITDLSHQLKLAVPSAQSVQQIVWNGKYWLIGGIGFLARYDGKVFTDLTTELNSTVDSRHFLRNSCCNAVSALAWNGATWLIGGGSPIAVLGHSSAWLTTYDGSEFTDLSNALPAYVSNPTYNSSILTISHTTSSWILGGYANGRGILLSYANGIATDMSYLVRDEMSTVDFVGVGTQPSASIPEYSHPPIISAVALLLAFVVLRRRKAHAQVEGKHN
jgi:hypothetical protein